MPRKRNARPKLTQQEPEISDFMRRIMKARKRNPQDASVSKVKQADDTLRDKVKFLGKRLRALENRVREVEARVTERAR